MDDAAARVLRSFAYGVSTHDSVTLGIVPLILMIVAFAAAFMPTLRIASIEPARHCDRNNVSWC